MPKILIYALELYFWGIRTEAYRQIFDRMLDLRLKKRLPLSDKRIVYISEKYFYAKRGFEKRERFMLAVICQYRGV